jgi:hypothetical protein
MMPKYQSGYRLVGKDAPELGSSSGALPVTESLRVAYFVVKTEMPPFGNWLEVLGWKGT